MAQPTDGRLRYYTKAGSDVVYSYVEKWDYDVKEDPERAAIERIITDEMLKAGADIVEGLSDEVCIFGSDAKRIFIEMLLRAPRLETVLSALQPQDSESKNPA